MKQAGFIFLRDIRSIASNWAALVVIAGLAFLPSLYAWFNIEASWDPYGNTSGIKVAVVNLDQGATVRGTPIHAGNEIVESLKNNRDIGWVFADERTALYGVMHGDYYASITIPENFSSRIATVAADVPRKAEIIYTVNEKINAVAPKITAKGASGIVEQVSQSFVKTANEAIFEVLNSIGVELERNLPAILKVRDTIFTLEKMIPQLNHALDIAERDVSAANRIVGKIQGNLPEAARIAQEGEAFAANLEQLLDRSAAGLDAAIPNIEQDVALLRQHVSTVEGLAGALQDAKIEPDAAATMLARAEERLSAADELTDGLLAMLGRLQRFSDGSGLTFAVSELGLIRNRLAEQIALLNRLQTAVHNGTAMPSEEVDRLLHLSQDSSRRVGGLLDAFDSRVLPTISQAIGKAKQSASDARAIMADAAASVPDVERIVQDAAKGLAVGKRELDAFKRDLPAAEAKVKELAALIRKLEQEGSLGELIDLLEMNAEEESEFFAEPVVLKENKLFPIPNYGSAMSPFFTTLSLWVGALLLVSLLTVEVHDTGADYRSYQVYFGRYMTFLAVAVFQSLSVTLGDIWILKTYVADKLWFVLFGVLLSAVFMLIVYTLVSVFGNVGKAMAIVLLVLQLAGSGGTFPIEVTPPFFQLIHPFLPFTYAIGMMREAVGGILWDVVARDASMMAVYAGLAMVVGLALKEPINRVSGSLVKKARESKLFH
ncbi:YhgE/Pip domain-containing protein [Paenibacillus thermotolerans]|uniref:YhgE/Pip domain-containing protein n=1 Tax=Paenibacillus thermotolerans TaxID=3027807 RepID=UPI0023689941|nr:MULTISPECIES: YhgE/Pip domain-containing protein [unclassified Paenibacillus]